MFVTFKNSTINLRNIVSFFPYDYENSSGLLYTIRFESFQDTRYFYFSSKENRDSAYKRILSNYTNVLLEDPKPMNIDSIYPEQKPVNQKDLENLQILTEDIKPLN